MGMVDGLSMLKYTTTDSSGGDNTIISSILSIYPEALVSMHHISKPKDILSTKFLVGITKFMVKFLVWFEEYLRRWDGLSGRNKL